MPSKGEQCSVLSYMCIQSDSNACKTKVRKVCTITYFLFHAAGSIVIQGAPNPACASNVSFHILEMQQVEGVPVESRLQSIHLKD